MIPAYLVPYLGWFGLLCVICGVVMVKNRSSDQTLTTAEFKGFQRSFFIVYILAMAADWMQGPYVYALYEHYGFSIGDIGRLFIAGFGSSMVFGTFIGSLADRFGRKLNCIIFCVMYALSCVTKHYNDYNILMVGRVLGGVATSILFSAPEAWMVSEHKSRGYSEDWLSLTFSTMTFGNGVVAILAGLVASFAASRFGFVAPFDCSMALLTICGLVVAFTWKENYGDRNSAPCSNFGQGWSVLIGNNRVLIVGIIQSCFEASMYLFVFMWTPRLHRATAEVPHGLVFAGFMVCIMIGSNCFGSLTKNQSVESLSRYIFAAAAASLAVPIFATSHMSLLFAFCGFELACGLYFPAMGTLRGKFVPEEVRSTVMNFYRVGLNAIVVAMLWNISTLSQDTVFTVCVCLQLIAGASAQMLYQLTDSAAAGLLPGQMKEPIPLDEQGLPDEDAMEIGEMEASKMT